MNSTDTRLGYPSIFIGSVLPSDAGLYTLTATNLQQDGVTQVGTDTGSFTLNVLCECMCMPLYSYIHIYIYVFTLYNYEIGRYKENSHRIVNYRKITGQNS